MFNAGGGQTMAVVVIVVAVVAVVVVFVIVVAVVVVVVVGAPAASESASSSSSSLSSFVSVFFNALQGGGERKAPKHPFRRNGWLNNEEVRIPKGAPAWWEEPEQQVFCYMGAPADFRN